LNVTSNAADRAARHKRHRNNGRRTRLTIGANVAIGNPRRFSLSAAVKF